MFFPILAHRNEVVWRGELDVDLQALLDLRNRPEHRIEVWHHLHVDVDGALAPSVEHRSRASGQIDACRTIRFAAQCLHESVDAVGVS